MKVTMLLCDHAAVSEGKLYINGGGWSITGPGAVSMGIAILISVPWDRANTPVQFQLRLVQEDGAPVMQEGPLGPAPVELSGEFEVGRPAGLRRGSPLDVPLAINLPPLPLTPGQRFSWELSIEGEDTSDDWHLAFTTREMPPQMLQAGGQPGGPGGV